MQDGLRSAFADLFGLDESEVTEELTPDSVDLWDSLNHLRLITALEEAFGIKLTMAEIEYMMGSVAKVREVLERHGAGQ
ncbi:MAG: acyl carrier protein [Aquisalimonadaceae bacterium]